MKNKTKLYFFTIITLLVAILCSSTIIYASEVSTNSTDNTTQNITSIGNESSENATTIESSNEVAENTTTIESSNEVVENTTTINSSNNTAGNEVLDTNETSDSEIPDAGPEIWLQIAIIIAAVFLVLVMLVNVIATIRIRKQQ